MAGPVPEELGGDAVRQRPPGLPGHPSQKLLVEQQPQFLADPDLPVGEILIPVIAGDEFLDQRDADETVQALRLNPQRRGLHADEDPH